MGVRTYETGEDPRPRARGPSAGAGALLGLVVLAGLLATGRPVGSGPPSVLAFGFDASGGRLVGVLLASIGCAAAAVFVFLAVGQRRPLDEARTAALLFVFGTTVWAAAHSFSLTAFSTALVAAALFQLVRAEDDEAEGPRAGLPLALAVALNPADLVLAAVLAFFAVARRPRQAFLFALWSLPGIAVALGLFMTAPGPPLAQDAGWALRLIALWASPVTGVLVFAPVVLVGLVGVATALRREDAPLAAACGAAFVAHGLILAARPLVGGTWGPRDWTDALPLCLLFLPEGLDRLKGVGTGLAFLSVAVQALGTFTYDGRWDRVVAPTPEKRAAVLWDTPRGPIPFAIRERTLIFAMPQIHDGKVRSAEHRIVLGAPEGARISTAAENLLVEGADPTFGNVHLQGGARLQGDRIHLESAGDAVFFRVRQASRLRRLEIRVVGRGQGTLAVEEASFWSPVPRIRERLVAGDFRWTLPYDYATSGGGDLRVSLRSAGDVLIASIRLVAPTEPDNVIRLQGTPDR